MIWPKISVITPSYNHAHFIEYTLQSVHNQHYPNLEHIIMDGGSKDGSVEIIKKYQKNLSYWETIQDKGQTDALIKGFQIASGDILCWLNSDDLFEQSTLREVSEFFRNNSNIKFIYGDSLWIDINGTVIRKKKEIPFNRLIWLYDHNYIPQPSAFWRRELYDTVGGLNPMFELAMDADLFIRFAEITKPHHVNRMWSRMRYYPEQKNQRLRYISEKEFSIIRERYLGKRSVIYCKIVKVIAKSMRMVWKLSKGCYL